MIDKTALRSFLETRLAGTGYFLVDLSVSASNEIKIEIDSVESVDIDYCMELSRAIEEAFPREPEDYELEVGSAGLTAPFKVRGQYEKNIGNEVEVLATDGKKYKGRLRKVDDDGFTVDIRTRVRREGEKRPVEVTEEKHFAYSDAKSVKYIFEF